MDLDYLITFIKDHPNLLFFRVSIVRLVLKHRRQEMADLLCVSLIVKTIKN